jgi:Ricin-type beta-trefoil lectin domain-like
MNRTGTAPVRPLRLLLWAAAVGLTGWCAGQANPADDGLKEIMGDGLKGYIASGIAPSPGYGYGVSFYSAAWPLVETPLQSFQIGLPSTWIVPDNAGYKGPLCPKGTVARDNWPERGPTYRDVFQTIEGGLGFWGSTQFGSSTPKYRMNGTPDCYNTEISSPGWGFGRPDPLTGEEMGMAQLSNRLLVPPDGFTLKTGARGELLGNAWMALPLTDYKGYFQLQTKGMEGADKCLEGNRPAPDAALHGASFMAPRGSASGQMWKLVSVKDGYFHLQTLFTEKDGLCLAGPKADPAAERMGAAFMAKSADSDAQLWKLVPAGDGYYRLTNKLREKDGECLEGDAADPTAAVGGAAHMAASGASDGQLWKLIGKSAGGEIATGDKSWTLFLNATNFKGPVAFYMPDCWSKIYHKDASIVGRGLDARPGVMTGGAMEINTVPYFEGADGKGVRYTRIPRLHFPVDAQGRTVLMQDVTLYSSEALYAPVKNWFNGEAAVAGTFDAGRHGRRPEVQSIPTKYRQGAKNVALTGIDKTLHTAAFGDKYPHIFGLQWASPKPTGYFPEYFKQHGDAMTAVAADDVPDETHLKAQTFLPAGRGRAYTSPNDKDGVWTKPGPTGDPVTVPLTDGSKVTYAWYRFVDQPALQQFKFSGAVKDQLQARVELLHKYWNVDHNYMPPPTSGTLATLDGATLVTPPKGLEVGYVPIITRQGPGN